MKASIASNKADTALSSHSDSAMVAMQERLTVGPGGVVVVGNVEGNIQITNKKIEVNADHGAVVNIYDAIPRVKKRDAIPQPARPIRGFVNRVNELKQVEQIITASEVAIILGMDGMGKSAFLRQAANSSAARSLADGVLFMEGIDERGQALGLEDVVQRLFDKSFESEPHLKVNFDIAQTYLGNLKSLVVLNGLDLSASSFPLVTDLFAQGPVLIESGQRIENEVAEEVRLGPLPRSEAMELLAAKAGIQQDDDTRKILDAICALLADVPLAIVITARAIRENTLTLKAARNMLVLAQPQAAEANRRGIERAYILAQSTLTELEQQWLKAAAFAPGISIDPQYLYELAEDPSTAERAKERLQAMGLLTANSPRLRIDPGLRDLARAGADEISLRERFLSYLKTRLSTQSLDWSFCADELGNILGMIDWAAGQQRWSDVIALGRAIDPYLTLHGLWEIWQIVIEDILRSARQLRDRRNEAWALHQLGTHAFGIGQTNQAIDLLRQALNLRSELSDTIGMAYSQHNLDLLIPPISGNDNGDPPDNPSGTPSAPSRAFKFLLKTISIVVAIAASGYLVANALHIPMIPHTSALIPTAVSTKRSSATPSFTPTNTLTLTPTNTATKAATRRPTRTPTATFTPSPTELLSLIGEPQLSTSQIYFGSRCEPNRITIGVKAQHPDGIKVVVFFHRLHELNSGQDSGWSEGLSMNPKGENLYSLSISGETLMGSSGFTMQTWASYQFVVQAKSGDRVRSTVYTDLSLLPCGGGAPHPHITISPSVTPYDPPATEPPIIIR